MNTTTKILALSLLCLLLTGALAAYMWFYLEERGAKLEADFQTVRDRDSLEREYKRLQEMLQESEDERTLLEKHVIAGEPGTVSFLSEIDEVAAELGIDLKTEELKVESTEEAGFDILVVKFSFRGSEPRATRLLKMFETLPYHGRMTALQLLRTYSAETETWSLGGTVTLALSIKET